MDFLGPKSIIVSSGRVVANTKDMPQPPCGGCRTCVEFKVDGIADTLDIVAGHHKVHVGQLVPLECVEYGQDACGCVVTIEENGTCQRRRDSTCRDRHAC